MASQAGRSHCRLVPCAIDELRGQHFYWSLIDDLMAAKAGKGLGKGLDGLPAELASCIWGLLDGDGEARRRLMQTSPSVRVLFSPSVQSLHVSLLSPSSSLLSGLHKDIRVRKLTFSGEADQSEEQKDQLCNALSLVSKSPLFRRVVNLTLKVGPSRL
jgi:hypothetical protein